ncbi:MAG: hypothetical protein J0H67_12040 [Rhodospirillales bacterium]|nr:hypothetical protein [Rhodospirillales bacterium]MBN8897200.1 hypothetical protein [Rhodospirillales bacterium]
MAQTGSTGPKKDPGSDETAREIAQDALDAYADGMEETGDKLARKAVEIDRDAVVEVVQEIDEAAQPTAPRSKER